MSERAAAMYHRRRAAGLCVRCGHLAIKGTTRCRRHRAERNEYQAGWRELKRDNQADDDKRER